MGIDEYIHIGKVAIETSIWVSAPILGLGLAAGLIVSIIQAATQINDAALAFIPKIAAAVAGLTFFGHYMMTRIAEFTKWVYGLIPGILP